MLSTLLTPDTVDYMIAGYVVFAGGIGLYVASLAIRTKKALNAYRLYHQELDQQVTGR